MAPVRWLPPLCVITWLVACRSGEAAPPVAPPAPVREPREAAEPTPAATTPTTSGVPCHLYREAGLLDVADLERVGICRDGRCRHWWRARNGPLSQFGATSDPLVWARFDERSLRPSEHYTGMRHARLRNAVPRVRMARLQAAPPTEFGEELARATAGPALPVLDAYLLICWAHQRELPAIADALAQASGPEVRDEAQIRPALAGVVLDQARRDLGEGVPRRRIAETLERAARLHPLPEIAALLDHLGLDGGPLLATDDPSAWASVLHDDVVYPERRLDISHETAPPPWGDASIPASPAWELVRLGWRALPAVVARAQDPQIARRDQRRLVRTVGNTALGVAHDVTGVRFGATALTSWWKDAQRLSEWDARLALIVAPHLSADAIERNVEGLIALDPIRARRELRRIRRGLPHDKRVALDESLRGE